MTWEDQTAMTSPSLPHAARPVKETRSASIGAAGYTLGRTLGAGRFSQVLHGKHTSGAEFAVKVIEQSSLEDDPEALEALQVEVAVLKAADHPYVVRLHEVVRTPAGTYLVMELLRGGELFDTIVQRGCFTEREARRVMRQLLQAVSHCHSLGIVHRDLKPENLLFTEDLGDLKIIDFGYAAILEPGAQLRGLSGTPDYAAPEVLSWYDEGDGEIEAERAVSAAVEYDAAADMWSVGVVLYILLCGFPPFYAEEEERLLQIVRSGQFEFASPYWDGVSAAAKQLVSSCLQLQPSRRPTPDAALRSEWMGQLEDDDEAAEAAALADHATGAAAAAASSPAGDDDDDDDDDEALDADAAPAAEPDATPAATPVSAPSAAMVAASPPAAAAPAVAASDPAAAPAAAAPLSAVAPSPRAAEMSAAEMMLQIRALRQRCAPAPVPRAGAVAAATAASGPSFAMQVRGAAGPGQPVAKPSFAEAPTRAALEAQGARFVTLPRALFDELYALCDAQRRGTTEADDAAFRQQFAALMQTVSAKAARGELSAETARLVEERAAAAL